MFDYIIIGAGSAGCLLANRLSQNEANSVLLLEAGGPEPLPEMRVPWLWKSLFGTKVDWQYKTEKQPQLNGRRIEWPRGKAFGGSSAINNMIYIRGNKWDFDHWAELGNEEWGYEDVLPFFKKSENQQKIQNAYHGAEGELIVDDLDAVSPVAENIQRFIDASLEFGLPFNPDFNGETQDGVGRYQYTRKNNERWGAADAWLKPALKRPNLTAIPYANVTKILMDGNRATGVEYLHEDEIKQATASKEIILSGGVINSPQLLLLSGIGPAKHLNDIGIPVVVDLPGVGENLQDHAQVVMSYEGDPPMRVAEEDLQAAAIEFEQSRTGLYGMSWGSVGAFVRTRPEFELPDMQLYSSAVPHDTVIKGDFYITLSICRPKDRGYIRLKSTNPLEHPIIQPNYFDSEEDQISFIDGVNFVRRLVQTNVYQKYITNEVQPGEKVQTDAEILAWLRDNLATTWHFVGTCKMGVDDMAVVDPNLRVHGVENLRVIDASVMPQVVAGNTNAATMMIAEKGADMLLNQ